MPASALPPHPTSPAKGDATKTGSQSASSGSTPAKATPSAAAAADGTIVYNRQILIDLVASGIDEVNLDYIRYPTSSSFAAIGLFDSTAAPERLSGVQNRNQLATKYCGTLRPTESFGMFPAKRPITV